MCGCSTVGSTWVKPFSAPPSNELCLELLCQNGLIAIDNVLWGGKVLDTENIHDEETVALREISVHVANDDRVDHVMLPFADGVTLVRKK
jgi:predicted O-methyltransferase YrrM